VSKSLVALRIRSLADCGEHAAGTPGAGVKGPQVQILSSRRETAGQRPFRTKSEAASLLPCSNGCSNGCSHGCSHGTRSHQPIAAESRWTAERAVGGDRCETICSGTPATSMCAANQCHSVCRPTPFIPKALAASDRPQCLLGLTAVPLPVVKTRPVSAQIEAALSRSTAWLALTHPRAPQSRGRGAGYGVSARFWAH